MSANILIIDDDPDTRDALSIGLSLVGYTVQVSAERACALRLLKEKKAKCDLIIMDYNMPGISAQSFLDELRSIVSVPVLLVTGSNRPAEIAARLGLPMYLEKPVDFELLVSTVEAALHQKV